MKKRQGNIVWMIVLFVFFWAHSALAVNWYVNASASTGGDGSSSSPFRTIQTGINAASAGDEVRVHEGRYEEDIVMKNGVALLGQGLWSTPVLAGTGTGPVVRANGVDATTSIHGFTIRGGNGPTGGGIEMIESSMEIAWCDFVNNTGANGGALYISGDSSASEIRNCLFMSNNAIQRGGAVAVFNGADPVFIECIFTNGDAPMGAGVSIRQMTSGSTTILARFTQCRFSYNRAVYGGAVSMASSLGGETMEPHFTSCEFVGNDAESRGGAVFVPNPQGRPLITNSIFRGNASVNSGSAIANLYGRATVMNCVFDRNIADSGGSGIYVKVSENGDSRFGLYSSILTRNGTSEIGGDTDSPRVMITDNLIEGGFGDPGDNNINADPLFVDRDRGDYRLLPESPCIDASPHWTALPDYDFTNRTSRYLDGDGDGTPMVDIGAYEYELPNRVYVDDDWDGLADGTRVDGHTIGIDAFGAIQPAIDAVAGPGNVIVHPGTYRESITLKANVVVEGRPTVDDPDVVVNGSALSTPTVIMDGCYGVTTTGLSNLQIIGNAGYTGVRVNSSQYIQISSCTISGAQVGLFMISSHGEIINSLFTANQVGVRNEGGDPLYTGCTLEENSVRGMENYQSRPRIRETVLRNHNGPSTDSGAAMHNDESHPWVLDCIFENNRIGDTSSPYGQGGAIFNQKSYPTFTRCEFVSNLAQQGGAVYSYDYSEPRFTNCLFEANQATSGGAVYGEMVKAWFDGCEFLDNAAQFGGASHSSENGAIPRFYNCVFAGNQATSRGGAVYAANLSVPWLINSVLWGNNADTSGGAIYENICQPLVRNSIVWGNTPDQIDGQYDGTTATYSDIQGGYPGTGNIDEAPLFTAPSSYIFQLDPASPCIETGSTDGGAVTDFAGNARPMGSGTDMGIYEYSLDAMIRAIPDIVTFGATVVGEIGSATVTIENAGLGVIGIHWSLSDGSHFTINNTQDSIGMMPGAVYDLDLSFAPDANGTFTDELIVEIGSSGTSITVPLSGAGLVLHQIMVATPVNGTIDPMGIVTVPHGGDQTFTVTPDLGYEIENVIVDGRSMGAVSSFTLTNVTEDYLIFVEFAPLAYTITAQAGSNGTIAPDGDITVTYGDSQVYAITPDSGYVVANVVVDGTSVGAVTEYTFSDVSANHTISVSFDTPHYFITATAGSGGTISPSGSVRVDENTDQTFTITPDPWLDIVDVLVDGASVGAVSSYTFTAVTANHTIEAQFADTVPDVWVDDDYTPTGYNDGHTWGTDAFDSVQAGIDAVTGPAIVHVAAGTYNEVIQLKNGVEVLGAGPAVTTLDGDGLAGLGIVVTADSVDSTATLAGFTIINGSRTTSATLGRGMNLVNSSPVIRDCIFEDNQQVALQNDNSSPRISNCVFRNNTGGGMRNINGSNPVLDNCLFETNDTYGMENEDSSPELTGCDFIGNYVIEAVSPSGGGMYNNNSNPRLTDCRFIDNRLDTAVDFKGGGGGMYNANNSSPEILRCEFTGNAAASGGAMFNASSSPTITDCTFTNNEGDVHDDDEGGAITSTSGSAPSITNCVFTGNSGYRGGAIYMDLSNDTAPPAIITNCIFNGNTALRDGGGIYSQFAGGALHITNSVFYNNDPDSDGDSFGEGGAIYNDRAEIHMLNSIARDNYVIEITTNVTVAVQYSNITGGYGDPADQNIDADPLFVDSSAGNFQLQDGSPCIDMGTSSSATVTLPLTDIDGTVRPLGLSHDMGAYEYAAGQDIDISSASLDFGNVTVGTTSSQDLTITNVGDQDLAISDIGLSDATHYAISNPGLPATIVAAGSITVTVDFSPTAAGQQDADLTITSNDPDESPLGISLTGVGVVVSHTITASAGTGGQITPTGAVSVAEGNDQSFGISANTGYTISDVLVDGSSVGAVGSYDFTNVTGDHTIEAQFAPIVFTITASAGSGGTISPVGATSVAYNGSQTFTISPGAGYEITDILVDGASVGAAGSYAFASVLYDHTIEARFAPIVYTITASSGSGGTISPAGAVSVAYNGSQSFSITPDTGYEIMDVLVDGVSAGAIGSYDFTNVLSNHTIEVGFTPIVYTIMATAGTGGVISPNGAVSVAYDGSQAFTIAADADYEIADVLVDGASVGVADTHTFTNVLANHTIEARFAMLPGITVGAVSGNTAEDGTTATFTVVLNRSPAGMVQIAIASDDISEGTVSTDNLTFSPADWDTPQTITVTGVDDAVDDGDQTVTVVLGSASSADAEYDGMDPADVAVVNVDDDTADVSVGAVSGDTDETGVTAIFTVVLTSEPAADVEIAVASDDTTEGEVSTDKLVFTPADWNTPQTVTVTGVDDNEEDGDMGFAILLAAAVSTDVGYNGIDPPDVILTNVDDDATDTPAGTGGGTGGGGGGGGGCFIGTVSDQSSQPPMGNGSLLLLLPLFAGLAVGNRRTNR